MFKVSRIAGMYQMLSRASYLQVLSNADESQVPSSLGNKVGVMYS